MTETVVGVRASEKWAVGIVVLLFGGVLGWIVFQVESVDDKREEGHNQIIEKLNASNSEIQKAIHAVEKEQAKFDAVITTRLEQLDGRQKK